MPKISSKHQITIPVEVLSVSGLGAGDEVSIEARGPDEIVVRRVSRDMEAAFGVFDGLFQPGYLDALRADERD